MNVATLWTGGRNTHRGARLRAGRRPSCKGSMPFFKTKRAMAMMGKTNACKKPKLEPDEPPLQSMKRCRFIDCGEAGRVRLAATARGRGQVHAAARPVRGRLPAVAHRDVVPSALRADAGGRRRSEARCRREALCRARVHESVRPSGVLQYLSNSRRKFCKMHVFSQDKYH